MAPPVRNDTAFIQFNFSQTGDPDVQMITLGLEFPSAVQTIAALGDKVRLAWDTSLEAFQDSGYTLDSLLINARDAAGTLFQHEEPCALVGDSVGDLPPPNTCLLVKKITGLAGRENRGRCYVPGFLQESDVDDRGVVLPASLATYQTAWDNFQTALEAGAAENFPIILHEDGTPETRVTSFLVDNVAATQRRRMR